MPSGAPFSSTRQPLRFAGAEPPRMGDRAAGKRGFTSHRADPLRSGRHHQRRSMTDTVPAAVLATTVCLAGSTVTACIPPWPNNGLCTGSGVDGDHGVVERLAT